MRLPMDFRARFAVAIVLTCLVPRCAWAVAFAPGDIYGTHYFSNTIVRYDAGVPTPAITVPAALADDIRGLAFGPEGWLYAVAQRGSGFAVLALDLAGSVHAEYPYASSYIGGNISHGKIAFAGPDRFYVGGLGGLVRFERGNTASGQAVFTQSTFDVDVLPSGNILAATAYQLFELTPAGSIVREIVPSSIGFTDIRGIEYDPAADDVFLTMLGHSGATFQLMKLDAATGTVLNHTSFWYGDDLVLTTDNRLLVGSRTQAPGVFSRDLVQLGSFSGSERMFLAQNVPEPATWMLAVPLLLALAAIARGRGAAR